MHRFKSDRHLQKSYLTLPVLFFATAVWILPQRAPTEKFQSHDLYQLRSVNDVQLSPDGRRIAYTVQSNVGPGRPDSQVWILERTTGESIRLGGPQAAGSEPRWSPDGKRIAFVSATPGPESEQAGGDPMVITRYLYKPAAFEGSSRFTDNRRLHLFVVDIETKQVGQLTHGTTYEHSIDWSPDGEEIIFVSNHEAEPDRVFNYDIFAVRVGDGTIRRLTHTESVEYRPRWSPDGRTIAYQGTKRGLTSSETTMEDTHIWLIDADGSHRREIGAPVDNRQGAPGWAPVGGAVYFTVQERGHVRLYRRADC